MSAPRDDKPKWTPGPWYATGSNDAGPVVTADGRTVVGWPKSTPSGCHAETMADARLIAAAPDLYAALADAPNPGYGQEAQRWMDKEYWPWWSKIRAAALAKAKP